MSVKATIIKAARRLNMAIFVKVLCVAAFCVLYLTPVSALPFNATYYAVLPLGMAITAVLLVFFDKKYIRYGLMGAILLYTVLGVSIGFAPFKNGVLRFFNSAIGEMNANRHAGYETYAAFGGFGSDFLFASVVVAWFALAASFSLKKSYVFICVETAMVIILLTLGLYPQYYVAVLLVFVFICILSVRNGFGLKAMCCNMVLVAVLSLVALPCYFYTGSSAITRFGENVAYSINNAIYGKSLPNGRLDNASGMRASSDVRLRLTLSPLTPTLYLKGYVGSEFDGEKWAETDKNKYVQNGYQGLISYVSQSGLPTTQYAKYSALSQRRNKYQLTVENVSADSRYIYAPYTLSEYSVGQPYYDMGLRGGVFTSSKYTYSVFAADESSERVTQNEWITNELNRTEAMRNYIEAEGQYRAFVYDTYRSLDAKLRGAVNSAVGDFSTTSVNTATQFIRSYFLDAYSYADECDSFEGDFAAGFFGKKIARANASYFATAATLMFREMGFASRYVEGYFVSVTQVGESERISVGVTADSTHAWSEVYFDGIGWLPIEVTPTFFAERAPDIIVDPDDLENNDTSTSDPSSQPEVPDVDPDEKPDLPYKPIITPEPEDVHAARLLVALKVILPIAIVALCVIGAALVFAVRQRAVRNRRRQKLNCDGQKFGRAAYEIVVHDCKHFGGFDAINLAKAGIDESSTKRFMSIVERCVYGGYTVEPSERKFVMWYIDNLQSTLIASCGTLRAMCCKYIYCMVI